MGSMNKKVRGVVAGLLVVGVLLPCWAWSAEDSVSLSVRVEGVYDDNRDGVENDKDSNFDIKLQPRAAFTYDWGQTYFSMFYMPYVLWRSDARDDQNDSEVYHELGVNFRHELTPLLTLKLSDRFSVTDDPRVSEGGVTVRESATYTMNVLNVGMDVEVDPVTVLSVGGLSSLKRYDKSVWNNYDEDKLGANLAIKREMGMMLNGLAQVRYTKSEYQGNSDRGAEYLFAGVGLEKTFSPNLAAAANVGWNTANYNELSGSKDTPAGDVRVVVSPSPDTSLSLSARYELADSDWIAFSTQERASLAATLDHRLTPKLSSALVFMYANGEYKSATAMVDGVQGGSDSLIAVRARAVYSLNRNLDLELGYQLEDWESDIRESFTRNKATVALKASL